MSWIATFLTIHADYVLCYSETYTSTTQCIVAPHYHVLPFGRFAYFNYRICLVVF